MLKRIGLKNFKAFGDEMQSAPLARLTFVYGPNSGGKSSLIQALLLLKQSRSDVNDPTYHLKDPKGKLSPRGEYIDLGSLPAIAHKHDMSNNIEVALAFDGYARSARARHFVQEIAAHMTFSPNRPDDRTDFTGFELSVIHDDETILHSSWTSRPYDFGRSSIKKAYAVGDIVVPQEMIEMSTVDFLPYLYVPGLAPESGVNWAEASAKENVQALRAQLEQYLSPEQYQIVRSSFTRHTFESLMDSITYLGPLRSYPERMYTVLGQNRESTGVRGEFTPDLLYGNPMIVQRANDWFQKLEIPYKLSVNTFGDPKLTGEYVALELVDQHTNTPVTLADVGFGINQLLPVIVEGLMQPARRSIFRSEHPIICIEQPEIHLHPRLQAEIADFMVETSSGRFGKQWLVETHSEMLIRRIQRRIEEGVISPDDVTVLYVDPRGSSGSEIRNLRLNDDGDFIDRWPCGFFEEAYNEIMGRGR